MAVLHLITTFFLFFSLLSEPISSFENHDYLLVNSSTFLSSLDKITNHVSGAKNHASSFVQVDKAIQHCLRFLNETSSLLISTRSRITDPKGTFVKSKSPSADIRTWLTAGMINSALCIEEIQGEGTSIFSRRFIKENQVIMSSVEKLLEMVRKTPSSNCTVESNSEKLAKLPSFEDANVVVSKDGKGNYTTITDAVQEAPNHSATRYVIHIKEGVYKERVVIDTEKINLVFVGDGMNKTVISFDRSNVSGYPTIDSSSLDISGGGFIARDLTVENTAGPEMGQAVAMTVGSDLSLFYKLHINGYQDTLYSQKSRQFYKECRITGTVDFIFGVSQAIFQNCTLVARKNLPSKGNAITAHGQDILKDYVLGYSFQFCKVVADDDLIASNYSTPTFLGRPWGTYSTTVFMQSDIGIVIKPEGWSPWNKSMPGSDTVFYGEYMNFGLGSDTENRANWRGIHLLNKRQATNFTVSELINGDCWLPATGIDYIPGFGN